MTAIVAAGPARGAVAGRGANAAPALRLPMSDGASIAIEVGGKGPSLLLVHGAGSFRSVWSRVIPLLQARFRTFAMDRRGHGDSSDGAAYSLEREAGDIAEVAAHLPRPLFVIGHSFGAIVVLEALKRTERMERAILYEPPVPLPGGVERPLPEPICDAVAAGRNETALMRFYTGFAGLPPAMIDRMRTAPNWPDRVSLAPTVCREMMALEDYRFDPASFQNVDALVMFILGGDSATPLATSVNGVASALGQRVTVLPGQQHDAMVAAPDMFAKQVSGFLL